MSRQLTNSPFLTDDDGRKIIAVRNPDGSESAIIDAKTKSSSITATGTFTGNGTNQTVTLGFEPDFIVVKSETALLGLFWCKRSWYNRADNFISTVSQGDAVYGTKTGFYVGSDSANGATPQINVAGAVHHYFAYKDNGSGSLDMVNWAGNATASRKIDAFFGQKIKGMIIKRDAPRLCIYAMPNETQAVQTAGSPGDYVTINGDGTLTLSADVAVNQWSGNLGEGTTALAFTGGDTYCAMYTGTGSVARVPLPWEPDFIIIQPFQAAGQNAHLWFSSLAAGQHLPAVAAVVNTGRITGAEDNALVLTNAANINTSGFKYAIYAFKKNREIAIVKAPPILNNGSIMLPSGAYIDCGTSDSLKFDGACTLEWFGAVYPPSTTPVVGGAGVNDELTKQVCLMARSDGADGVSGTTSFNLSAVCPRVDGGTQEGGNWDGVNISWAVTNRWDYPPTNSDPIEDYPPQSGLVMAPGRVYHLTLTHNGSGKWDLYIDGKIAKCRERDMVAAKSWPNIRGGSGHRMVIGGRQRASIQFTNGQQFRLARIYARGLTSAEVLKNYNSAAYGSTLPTPGFIEEWNAANAGGTTLKASVNSANNGTIVGGTISRPT